MPDIEEWPENVLLTNEKEALGFYITGHPLARHSDAIKRFATCDTASLSERSDREEVRVCGLVAGIKELATKRGDRMARVTLEDLSGFVETIVFPETYQTAAELLNGDEPLLVTGTLEIGEESCKILANDVILLRDVKEKQTSRVHFRLSTPGLDKDQLRQLRDLLLKHRGECDALLHLVIPNRSETMIRLPENLKVAATDQLMDDTERLFSYNVVTFE